MKKIALLVALLVVSSASSVHAAAVGSALLSITDFKVIIESDGGAAPPDRAATGSFFTTGGPGAPDLRISSVTTTATNQSDLTGFPNSFQSNTLAVIGTPGGPLVGPFGVDGFAHTGAGAPTNNVFASLGTDPYTRADSLFGGSPLSLIDGTPIPFGGFASTFADFAIDTPNVFGGASGNVTSTSSIVFAPTSSFTARIDLTALSSLALAYSGSPAGVASQAANSFVLTLSKSGIGGIPGFAGTFTPGDLNTVINQGAPGLVSLSTGPLSYSTTSFTLEAGTFYTLTLNQTSSVRLVSVPEPTSIATFGILGLGATFLVRRRNRK